MPPGSVVTAEPHVQVAQQIKPQNDAQQVQRPLPTQLESPSGSSDQRCLVHDQGRLSPEAAGGIGYTELYLPGKPRTWPDLLTKAFWAYHISKRSGTGTAPDALTYGQDTDVPINLKAQFLRFTKQPGQEVNARAMAQELGNLEQSRLDAYNSMQAQE